MDSGESVEYSNKLVKEGRWEEAISLLEQTRSAYPDAKAVGNTLLKTRRDWRNRKQTLEDLVLIYEADALHKKIPIAEKLFKAQPDSYLLNSRLLIWQQELKSRVDDLLACGSFHMERNLGMAKLCLDLARKIEPGSQTDALYALVKRRERAKETTRQKKQQADAAVSRAEQAKQLALQAEALSEAGNLVGALVTVEGALNLDPQNPDLKPKWLLLKKQVDEQVNSLDAVAERLYREEHLEAAIAAWESALQLSPDSHEILAKLKRARTVLKKLKHLETRGSNPAPIESADSTR
ncbi:hypothetical protein BOW51_07630 [Solemya velesiana gill symbiont]|uniref:Tetratricopeptide repeat protein n=1 Tax=Solemya velesiana gill symbiont TaxID=1918948 RepID=A0A1T2KU19_9GAMM|nr:hypothetical protein BOW51_07630 [Solemya velesiana gill symbiont]